MKEIWKLIPGYKGLYDVSNMGRVRRICDVLHAHYKKGDILNQGLSWNGYPIIGLNKNAKQKLHMVHRLVLLAFVGPCPKGKEGSHLNDIKTDNLLKNLAWMTRSENMKLGYKNSVRKSWLLGRKGKDHPLYGRSLSIEHKEKISLALVGNQNRRR